MSLVCLYTTTINHYYQVVGLFSSFIYKKSIGFKRQKLYNN